MATCRRAIARAPLERFASAAELNDALERYLDGDRDVELRRRLSARHANEGRLAAERAFSGTGNHEQARKAAAAEIGRALALDPDNAEALRTLLRLLTEPPRVMPPEPVAAARAAEVDFARHAAWMGGFAHVGMLAGLVACPFFLGLREPLWFAATATMAALAALVAFARAKRLQPLGGAMALSIALALLFALGVARGSSPIVIFPLIVTGVGAIFVMHVSRRGRVGLMLACTVALIAPIVAEAITPLTLWRGHKEWVLRPLMFGDLSLPMTAGIHVLVMVFCCVILGRYRDHMRTADLHLQFQAWQLRQVVGDAGPRIEERSSIASV